MGQEIETSYSISGSPKRLDGLLVVPSGFGPKLKEIINQEDGAPYNDLNLSYFSYFLPSKPNMRRKTINIRSNQIESHQYF